MSYNRLTHIEDMDLLVYESVPVYMDILHMVFFYAINISSVPPFLTYSILYKDDEMFDGIYKILKYKTMVDKDGYFKEIAKTNSYSIKQVKTLISFMQKVSNKFDNKKVFELDKIERMIKIGNY